MVSNGTACNFPEWLQLNRDFSGTELTTSHLSDHILNNLPPVISYNTVLAAAASTSRWRDALSILDECHRAPGVEPDIYTYTNAIRACAKGTREARFEFLSSS